MSRYLILFFLLSVRLIFVSRVWAVENPLAVPNNHFGIHIIDENDIEKAAQLVNSAGGDWGYVTLVIRSDDLDKPKWQRIFERLRDAHLIPLLRLATVPEGNNWQAPKPEDAVKWADFLNSLTWVVKNRYVILFNEPNHAKEWGGAIKPGDFAEIVKRYSQALKAKSPDFYILPGAVDSASPDSSETMSAKQFYKWMHAADPAIFSYYDGLVSHSYPHPDFVGRVTDRGAGTITAYRWELDFLKNLGLNAQTPVFITETGWAHNGGKKPVWPSLTPAKAALLYETAFTKIWTDPQIVAITPFILNYQDHPFDQFSWLKPGATEVYPQFEKVKNLPKTAGQPARDHRSVFPENQIPLSLVSASTYFLPLKFINAGQTVWDPALDKIILESPILSQSPAAISLPPTPLSEIGSLSIFLTTPVDLGTVPLKIFYQHRENPPMLLSDTNISIIPPPALYVKLQLWYKRHSSGDDFTLLIYKSGDLVKKITKFNLLNGEGIVNRLTDVIPNQEYRFVITKPYYMPRQTIAVLNDTETTLKFERMLPFDLNLDGRWSLRDLGAFFTHPLLAFNLWWW